VEKNHTSSHRKKKTRSGSTIQKNKQKKRNKELKKVQKVVGGKRAHNQHTKRGELQVGKIHKKTRFLSTRNKKKPYLLKAPKRKNPSARVHGIG